MTIQIQNPQDGTQVAIGVPNYSASGYIDSSDDVSGYLLDTTTDNAFGCIGESLDYNPATQVWDWTLQFQTDNTIALNDYVTVNVYDAATGGDGESVTIQQNLALAAPIVAAVPGAAAAPAYVAAPHVAPSIRVQAAALTPAAVQDITVTVTLQPAGAKGSVFLSLLRYAGGSLALHHHLPPSTQVVRTVIFRNINVNNWDRIHAVGVITRRRTKPQAIRIK